MVGIRKCGFIFPHIIQSPTGDAMPQQRPLRIPTQVLPSNRKPSHVLSTPPAPSAPTQTKPVHERLLITPGFALLTTLSGLHAAECVDFNRDIRPILTKNCTYCHGADANHRIADLRLDVREDAIPGGATVPGDAARSELVFRIQVKHHDGVFTLRTASS